MVSLAMLPMVARPRFRAATWRQRAILALTFFGTAFVGMGLASLNRTQAAITGAEWNESMRAVIAIGCAPIGAFLLLDTALWMTRRWVASGPTGEPHS